MKRKPFEESSGNVFLDIGFPPDEAASLTVRSDLMICLREAIRKRKLTQAKAARLFGVSQPRISNLMQGKIELFSTDSLIAMLTRAGMRVGISVRPRAA